MLSRAVALTLLLAVAGCGAGSLPDVNRSFDDLACTARDFSGDPPC